MTDSFSLRSRHWVEFPGATQDGFLVRDHNSPALESAIQDARHTLGCVMKSDGSPGNDADVAVVTNRDTGYRWILHRGSATVEFQTPGMLAEQVARDHLNVYLSVEEAEALADAAESAEISDKRRAAVARQATGQIRLLAGQVREARRRAETEPDVHRRKPAAWILDLRDFGPPPGPGSGTERETTGVRGRRAVMLWPWKFPRFWEISRVWGFKSPLGHPNEPVKDLGGQRVLTPGHAQRHAAPDKPGHVLAREHGAVRPVFRHRPEQVR
jgi:hypothetical protein